MDPRPPVGMNCPSKPLENPDSTNFHHPQFSQCPPFSQSLYAMNFPRQQFPQQPPFSQNYHFVVVQPQYAPFSPPPPPALVRATSSASVSDSGTPHSVTGLQEQVIINIDNDGNGEPERSARRLPWTQEEDLRLISAWLNNSKKSDTCWADVAAAYNSTIPRDRRRELKQLKDHWQRTNKKIAFFNGCWCQVKAANASGQSNGQLMDNARAMYLEEAKHDFTLDHWWKTVWDQPKWKAYISSSSFKRTKLSELGDYTSSSKDTEDVPEKETRPQGCKTAKVKQKGKGKGSSSSSEVQEDIQCLEDIQTLLKKDCKEMTDAHICLLDKKVESAHYTLSSKDTKDVPEMVTCPQGCKVAKEKRKGNGKLSSLSEVQEDIQRLVDAQAMLENDHEEMTELQLPLSDQQLELANNMSLSKDVPEKETRQQSYKAPKEKRKGKGKVSSSLLEVREDTQCLVNAQTILKKGREEMTEVQLCLSGQKLEPTRLKQLATKDKKGTKISNSKKHTELLMTDTSRLIEFQKAEPGGFLNWMNCPNEPLENPNSRNFLHPQFLQHLPFSQSPYALNFPHQQFVQQPPFSQNFHLVQPQYAPYSRPPPPPLARGVPSTSVSDSGTSRSVTGSQKRTIIDVDNDDNGEPERSARRLAWTQQEDLRLINAWLNNSKKGDMYWANVAEAYNRATPRDRRRGVKQLKDHWHRTNKKIADFNGCWCQVKATCGSGRSDYELMDNARAMYLEKVKHHFTLDYWWKAVWDQPMWKAYIYSSYKRTKLSESGDYTSSSKDTEDVPEEETRPQGCKVAKAKRKGKGKAPSSSSEVQEDIQRLVDAQTMLKKDSEEMAQVQLRLSSQKLESARLMQLAAKDKKETKIYEAYTELLMADTSKFNEFQKAEHEKALRLMGERLFGRDDD